MSTRFDPYLQIFRSRRIAVILLFGFSSGLPLSLTGSTLQAWMTGLGVNLHTIGILSLVGLPYTLKFLWSPVMDRFVLPWLGRRRGWIIVTQTALVFSISAMTLFSPLHMPWLFAAIALTVTFFSASQDIVIDAYRTDVLQEKERGVGAAVFVTGYRIAMLVSGAFALILSDQIGWQRTYFLMAGLMTLGILTTLLGKEPGESIAHPPTIQEAVVGPLRDFFSRDKAVLLLCLIVLYKLCDAYAGSMTIAFLIRGLGFSATEVGTINKFLGLLSLIVGAMFGGMLMVNLGLYRALLIFGVLQAGSILSFVLLASIGKNYGVMIFAVAFENLTGGMGTSAFVALLMALCTHRYSATQYALLSSLAALGRVMISPTSGYLIEYLGWANFFVVSTLSALPGLWLLRRLRSTISMLKHKEN
ncbi:MAG: AmpG family muropeptide MFS transporter [Dissulfurispiraceae bacterium]